jgi:hypothetical protein
MSAEQISLVIVLLAIIPPLIQIGAQLDKRMILRPKNVESSSAGGFLNKASVP